MEDVMDLIARSRRMRSCVRFAGQRFRDPPNLAEHGYATASLFIWLAEWWDIPISVNAIKFVLNHDVMETETGDLLFPIKHYGKNEERWAEMEREVLDKVPYLKGYTDATAELTDEEQWLFKYCDCLEGLLTSREELLTGNKLPEPSSCCQVYSNAMCVLHRKLPKSLGHLFNKVSELTEKVEG